MPTVCVGCGLTVVGGVLAADPAGIGLETDAGLTCNEAGKIDFVVPTMKRSIDPDGVNNTTDAGFPGPFRSRITNISFDVSIENSSDGILTVLGGTHAISVINPGVYSIHLNGGFRPTVPAGNHALGGHSRLFVDGVIAASDGGAVYAPSGVDMSDSTANDGPEWNCSAVLPLDAGAEITWEILGQNDTTGINHLYPAYLNTLCIARLGSIRA